MKVWLVGGHGMLGSALRERLEQRRIAHVVSDRELDIAVREPVQAFALRERPTHVLNAAAYSQVDDAETHEAEALAANAAGPEHLGLAATSIGARLVHFSTDYVFDGRAREPYREDAVPAPLGAYGRSKLAGEQRVLALPGARELVYVVRTSWLFGEHGHNFARTIVGLLKEQDELAVVSDRYGRPTYAGDLADAALSLAGLGKARAAQPAVYHFANRGVTSWHGLATAIREGALALGHRVRAARVIPITASAFPQTAQRPAYSVLDTARIEAALGLEPRPWQLPLMEFLSHLGG
jgi:dTDP-4-dehydrorhamnose reductase